MSSRRQFLKSGCLGAAFMALETRGFADTASSPEPVLGLIFPPAHRPVPEEALIMYPGGVRFIAGGLGLERITPEGFDGVIERIGPTAQQLASNGAKAITLMGTSLSFYLGEAFNQRLTDLMKKATGLPATTMSTAVVEGLRAVGGDRLAVATAYNSDLNRRLEAFLHDAGFEVLIVKGLGIEDIRAVDHVTRDDLLSFGAAVYHDAPKADAILISCGGLRTLEVIAPLEERCGVPVISSTPHALWADVRLLGLGGHAPGFGRLLAQ